MKYIFCKSCGKRFFVNDREVSDAEKSGLCDECNNRHESVKVTAR